jgi:hypothetical protein
MTIRSVSISRFQPASWRRKLAFVSIAGVLMGTAGLAQPPAEAPQQTAFIDFPDAGSTPDAPGAEVARLYGVGGYWAFVRQSGGDVGIVAAGGRALEVLQALTAQDSLSALEIYEVLGGSRNSAPDALLSDHQKRVAENPVRPTELPKLSSLKAGAAPLAVGFSDLGILDGAACVKGSLPTYDYFKWSFWQGGVLMIPPGNTHLEDIGANGQKGIGIWNAGEANLILGSTSAGAAAVCFPQSASNAGDARLTVQEFYGNGLWVDLWSTPYVFQGVAYGYWFKGPVVHKIRLLVRDKRPPAAQNPPIGPFYWAGAY